MSRNGLTKLTTNVATVTGRLAVFGLYMLKDISFPCIFITANSTFQNILNLFHKHVDLLCNF